MLVKLMMEYKVYYVGSADNATTAQACLKKAKSKVSLHSHRVSLSVFDYKLHCEPISQLKAQFLALADGILIEDVLSIEVDDSKPRFIYILTTKLEVCLKSKGEDDAKPLAQALQTAQQKQQEAILQQVAEQQQHAAEEHVAEERAVLHQEAGQHVSKPNKPRKHLSAASKGSSFLSARIRGIPIGFFLTVFALAAATQLSHVHIKGQPVHVLAMDYSCALSERLFGHFPAIPLLWQCLVEANGTRVSVPAFPFFPISSTPHKTTLLRLAFSTNATQPISTTAAIVSIIAPEGSFLREQALVIALPLLLAVVAGFSMLAAHPFIQGMFGRNPNWQRYLRVAAWLLATAVLLDHAWTTLFLYEIPILASVLLTLATGTLLRAIFVTQLLRDETVLSTFGFLCAKVLTTYCAIFIVLHPELKHLLVYATVAAVVGAFSSMLSIAHLMSFNILDAQLITSTVALVVFVAVLEYCDQGMRAALVCAVVLYGLFDGVLKHQPSFKTMAIIALYHRLSEITVVPINWEAHSYYGHLLRIPYIIIGYVISIVFLCVWSFSLVALLDSKEGAQPFLALPIGWFLCFVANSISRANQLHATGAVCISLAVGGLAWCLVHSIRLLPTQVLQLPRPSSQYVQAGDSCLLGYLSLTCLLTAVFMETPLWIRLVYLSLAFLAARHCKKIVYELYSIRSTDRLRRFLLRWWQALKDNVVLQKIGSACKSAAITTGCALNDYALRPLFRLLARFCSAIATGLKALWRLFRRVVFELGLQFLKATAVFRLVGTALLSALLVHGLSHAILSSSGVAAISAFTLATWTSLVITALNLAIAVRSEQWTLRINGYYENLDFNIPKALWWVTVKFAEALAWGLKILQEQLVRRMWTFSSALFAALARSFQRFIKPLLTNVSAVLSYTWNSPVLPFFASVTIILLAYLNHAGTLEGVDVWVPVRLVLDIPSLLVYTFWVLWGGLLGCVQATYTGACLFVGGVFYYWRALESDLKSSNVFFSTSFAVWFYVINAMIGRLRLHHYVPWKTIMIPVLIVVGGLSLSPDFFRISLLGGCCWSAISVLVWRAEYHHRERARQQLQAMQEAKARTRKLLNQPKPEVTYEATQCLICLEDFDALEGGDDHDQLTLPCGHSNFHGDCLTSWFSATTDAKRCPMCRQPIETSLLQVAFC